MAGKAEDRITHKYIDIQGRLHGDTILYAVWRPAMPSSVFFILFFESRSLTKPGVQ